MQIPLVKFPAALNLSGYNYTMKIIDWRSTAVRIGTQMSRWEHVTENLGKMKIQTWSKMAIDREAWKRTVEQAKIHKEL